MNERFSYIGARLKGRLAGAVEPVVKTQACRLFVGMGFPVPPSLRSSYILGIYFKALARYAADPYRGQAVLFTEKNRPDQARYWLNVLAGATEVHSLPAQHGEVVTPLNVEAWARHLRESLRRSQRGGASLTSIHPRR